MEISVGPPTLTINHGSTFMVTDLCGQINPCDYLGLFSADTRFLSYYACYANGQSWIRLTSSATKYYAARIYLKNPELRTDDQIIPTSALSLVISRTAGDGIHEDLDITNHSLQAVRFYLEITLRSDFADIFEVGTSRIVRRGLIETRWDKAQSALHTTYQNGDFYRCLIYQPHNCTSQPHYTNGRVSFEVVLEPGEVWHTCCHYIFCDGDRVRRPVDTCDHTADNPELDQLQQQWRNRSTLITSYSEDVYRLYRQSLEDLSALRLYDQDLSPDVWLPAAGVPKFVTLFGRDALIASLQNMLIQAGFASGVLQKLAQLQATELDDWRDAEPGKMLHEIRSGELAHFQKIPHTPYYGTADTTPLYLIVLHETWKWLGDISLLRDYRQVALRCLDWIDQYGDLDGDGLQEYKTRSSAGIKNMGWKDSDESVVYPDGSQVEPPKALCELQGYVFDAWMRMAEVFDALEEPDRAVGLRQKAAKLQAQFESSFWCEDLDFYAFALDPDKQPVRTIASNPGHCLWSGIVRGDRAAKVVERLLQPDMWTGWGLRTLSADNPAYNPFYHLGSVWPHDNGMIALGFKRYGFSAEAAKVMSGISEAARHFASYRLPELYAGIDRQPGAFPVPYLEANVPQAWAAGSVFHLLQAILGVRADAPNHCLYVDPALPEWLPDITLHKLGVGRACVDLRFWREGDRTRWDASVQSGNLNIREQPWQPWNVGKYR